MVEEGYGRERTRRRRGKGGKKGWMEGSEGRRERGIHTTCVAHKVVLAHKITTPLGT